MNRTNHSTRTSIVDKAVHLGANVEFNYSTESGQENPTTVTAVAVLQGGGMVNVNVNKLNNQITQSVTFANGAKTVDNAQLADDLVEECKLIVGSTVMEA